MVCVERVSCCILTYKKYEKVYSSIASVLGQDYDDIELILADDGSGDFPKEKIEDFIEKRKGRNLKRYIVYSNDENLGTVKNLNTALKKTTGRYIISLSSDDVFIDNQVFKEIVAFFKTNDFNAVMARAAVVYDDERNGICMLSEREVNMVRSLEGREMYNRIAKYHVLTGACFYYTREFLEENGFYNEQYRYIEDWSRFLELYRHGKKVGFIDRFTIKYSLGGISNNPNVPLYYLEDNLKICEEEILKNESLLEFFSKRYVECRVFDIKNRINNGGKRARFDLFKILLKYPDVVAMQMWNRFINKYGKRKKWYAC